MPLLSQNDDRPENNLPERIGRYPVLKKLGRGAMGTVYLGKHPSLDRKVAIKVMSLSIAQSREPLLKRFIQEAKITDRFNHPNVIRVYDAGEDDSEGYFIVMEYAEGGDLNRLLKTKGKLDVTFALEVVISICRVLVEANKHNVIHRDIKPQNIMLGKGMAIKLADLGLAKYLDNSETDLTLPNTGMGTPNYMAPEQFSDAKSVDVRADIYALGATFYQLITGKPPFSGNSAEEIIKNVVVGNYQRPEVFNPSLDKRISDIIDKMIALKPEDRYQTPEALLKDLTSYGGREKLTPSRIQRGMIAGTMVTIIAAVVYLAWPMMAPSNSTNSARRNPAIDLAIRISDFAEERWKTVKDSDIAFDFSKYTRKVRHSFAEAGLLFEKKLYEEAFHEYREILKLIQKLENLGEIRKRCITEQNKIQQITDRVKKSFPDLVLTDEWRTTEGITRDAYDLFQKKKLMEALELFTTAANGFTGLFNFSVGQHLEQLKEEVKTLRGKGLTLKAPELVPEVWQNAEDFAKHAQDAEVHRFTEAIHSWEKAIARYNEANQTILVLQEANVEKEKYFQAISQLDSMLIEKYKETLLKTALDTATEAQRLLNAKEFQPAVVQWRHAVSLILISIEEIKRIEPPYKDLTNPTDLRFGDGTGGDDVAKHTNVDKKIESIGINLPNQTIKLTAWINEGKEKFVAGENFSIAVRSETDCYLAIFCHYSNGKTLLLFPNAYNSETSVAANLRINVPDIKGAHNKQGFKLEVCEPFGRDVIEVIACSDKNALNRLIEGNTSISSTPFASMDRNILKNRVRGVRPVPYSQSEHRVEWGISTLAIHTFPR